jgi:iron(III) transport system ATP-binding protein
VQGGLVLAVANPHDSADAAVIRPEDIRIARHEPTLENAFRAKVLAVIYLGASIRYRLALENGTELSAVSANAAEPAAVGDQVWAEWPARATLLVGRR